LKNRVVGELMSSFKKTIMKASKLRFLILAGVFALLAGNIRAQYANVKDSMVFAPMVMPTGGVHFPLGDAKDYKFTYHVGGQFLIKTRKNWLYGFSGEFMVGENAGNGLADLVKNIYPVYGKDGTLPGASVGMRGFNFMAQGGKIVALGKKPNKNSGLMFLFGAGFIEHQIQIDFRGDLAPQVIDDYKKGYDHLSYGFAMSQFIGYMYMGNNRSLNFFGGVEFIEGFTRNRRLYNYSTGTYDLRDKYDIFIGLKVGYVFPFYRKGTGSTNKSKEKEYFYK
jgi:hypothetical protein